MKIVRCWNNNYNYKDITILKNYNVLESDYKYYKVENDKGIEVWINKNHFIDIEKLQK